MEEGVSVAAPRGDMDGSRIRVTDISESCRGQKVFSAGPLGLEEDGAGLRFTFLICVPSLLLFPAQSVPFFVPMASF